MNLLNSLTRPYYVYRPMQILRRLRFEAWRAAPCRRWIVLPWGLRLNVTPEDEIGQSLGTSGINDLSVTEAIYRLLDPGETAVDVGANIGYTTSIMAVRVSPGGRVVAFEPHPSLFSELREHVADWERRYPVLRKIVETRQNAIGRQTGESILVEPAQFSANRGRSQIDSGEKKDRSSPLFQAAGKGHSVAMMSLDAALMEAGAIGLLKVDVEGHEAEVFGGASELLSRGKIRDTVFEEFEAYPAQTHRMLENYGYRIFVIEQRLLGPILLPAHPDRDHRTTFAPPNYVATRDPERLRKRFSARGWKSLRSPSRDEFD